MTSRTFWHKRTKGQAMVETAFILFILVLLAFGITEFGRAMYTKNSLYNAARAGARQAIVTLNLTTDTQSLSPNCNYGGSPSGNDLVYQAVCNSLYAGINKGQVSVQILAPSPLQSGNSITVNLTYGTQGNASTGFQSVVPQLIPITNVLTASSTMRYE